MKYTGIVRRLDSLGRIVIPREYRKMHKIKESDPLEIIAMENGEILIKKVDLSAELLSEGMQIAQSLFDATSGTVLLADNEKVIYAAGDKNTYLDNPVSAKILSLISSRKSYNGPANEVMPTAEGYACVYPVFKEDAFGALIMLFGSQINAEDERLVKTLAKVLGNIMQKY